MELILSNGLYRYLSWLPAAPADFAERCRGLSASGSSIGKQARELATFSLNEHQLAKLGRTIETARKAGLSLAPLAPFRLGLLGNGTLDLIVPALVATAARHGIALECIRSGYNQFLQDALLPDSDINRSRPDAVLLALGSPRNVTPDIAWQ